MDPFLDLSGFARNSSMPRSDIAMSKMTAIGDRCLVSEGPATARNKPPSMDLSHDPEMPTITSFNNSVDEDSHSLCLEVRRAKRGNVFLLRGEGNDENSVSLILRMADQNGKYILTVTNSQSHLLHCFFHNNRTQYLFLKHRCSCKEYSFPILP